jgi:hypothetical protein
LLLQVKAQVPRGGTVGFEDQFDHEAAGWWRLLGCAGVGCGARVCDGPFDGEWLVDAPVLSPVSTVRVLVLVGGCLGWCRRGW